MDRITTPFLGYPVPLPLAFHALLIKLFGLNPAPFHALSVVVHTLNVWLVYRLVKLWTGTSQGALWGALLWCAHPVLAEAICWATSLKDLLCSTGVLIACLGLVSDEARGERRSAGLIALGAIIAYASKPAAVILGPLLLMMDLIARRAALPYARSGRPFALVLCLLAPLYAWLASASHAGFSAAVSSNQTLLSAVAALRIHVENVLVPLNLHVLYAYAPPTPAAWLVVAAVCAAVVAGVIAAWRSGQWLFVLALLWAPLCYAPYSKLLGSAGRFTGDSYLYLALVALAWGVAALWREIKPGSGKALVIILALLAALTWGQVSTWRDSLSLWLRVTEYLPEHPMPRAKLGQHLYTRGAYELAIEQFEHTPEIAASHGASLPFSPQWPMSYAQLRRFDEAEALFVRYLSGAGPVDGSSAARDYESVVDAYAALLRATGRAPSAQLPAALRSQLAQRLAAPPR